MNELSFASMGTTVRLLAPAGAPLGDVGARIEHLAARLTRFRAASELSALNADPRPVVAASPLLRHAVGVGLATAGRAFQTPGLAKRLMALHEHAALAGLIAIAVHGITLLGDSWLHPGPVGIAVPFTMDYKPAFTGLGIVGGYLAAALGLSFYARRRIGARLWRTLHRATILVYALSVVHTLGAGTDASEPWLRIAMAVTGAPILYLLVVRTLPAPQRPRPTRRRTGTSAMPGAS